MTVVAQDTYPGFGGSPAAPHLNAAVVTPDDNNDLPFVAYELLLPAGGAVKLTTKGGQTLVYPSLPAGAIIRVAITRVFATGGTTATSIIAHW
jgi:hypothetical protein